VQYVEATGVDESVVVAGPPRLNEPMYNAIAVQTSTMLQQASLGARAARCCGRSLPCCNRL